MDTHATLAQQFEAERPRLQAMAYRMLGSLAEAEDAVQEVWLHLSRCDASTILNLGGWLTTAVARVCLNVLHARKSRREESLEASVPEAAAGEGGEIDPEKEMELADAVGLALLVVLDMLAPAERLAFVLHDIFAVPFDEIAPIVQRSEAATRQLASRARRRVRGRAHRQEAEQAASREVVEAFLAAAREGNFEALLSVLDPEVVLRFDSPDVPAGIPGEIHGAAVLAQQLVERAQMLQACRAALVNGSVGIVVAPQGRLLAVGELLIRGGKITALKVIAGPARLRQVDLAVLEGR
ncbi:RNA polymerase subunit sigma-70 [Ktedonosporobacter rubrisoli]|uniref:RNA polymerase subunit sigma-70 n=1 Tax=Ktedonosporobacter rubrisoli TaxID=2509675 RepID=A0A4V0YYQ5_KTERU|nr:sigma factor [Ktedonosporobacter rubrisoli]QBD77041.1 RNA polymerase subunit sigma-70 [Ktedonosporobacter rubrisoli]